MSDYVLMPGDRVQIDKDPQSSLLYGLDVGDVLAPGDQLTGTPTVSAAGLTVSQIGITGTVIRARVSGGTVGQVVPVTWGWSTVAGDSDQRTVYLRIVER